MAPDKITMRERYRQFVASHDRYREAEAHVVKYQTVYAAVGSSIATALVMRVVLPTTAPSIAATATSGSNVVTAGKSVTMQNVSFIASNRKGPPSWVVRCLETDDVFTSQQSAAAAMSLPASEISRHLNGTLPNVRGFNFERLCVAG